MNAEKLKEIFEYRNGELWWKVNGRCRNMNQPVGSTNSGLFRVTTCEGKRLRTDKIVWALHHGVYPTENIYHIDGDKLNDAIENLTLTPPPTATTKCKDRVSTPKPKSMTKEEFRNWYTELRNGKPFTEQSFDRLYAMHVETTNWSAKSGAYKNIEFDDDFD